MVQTIKVTDGPAIIHYRPYVGATWSHPIISFRQDGGALDVSSDTFEFILEDADGAEQGRLTMGDGIEFEGDGIRWTFTHEQTAEFVKDAAWVYALWWIRASDGHRVALQAGNVIPKKYTVNDVL